MDVEIFWFCVVAFFWAGYFLLEGFDFGVGMLLPFVGRDDRQRGTMLESIGPVWDGNEVWLVIAAGATFAAFPAWYATMFSGFYLVLVLALVFLILRVVSFEWGEKSENRRWRRVWFGANVLGSFGAPFIWGVALANLVHGVPLDGDGEFSGSFADLFSPFTIFAGLATVAVFMLHGAAYLTLRTRGALYDRATVTVRRLVIPVAVIGSVLALWTVWTGVDANDKDWWPAILPALGAVAALALAVLCCLGRRPGLTFAMTAVAIVAGVATTFVSLYPRVMVSQPDFGNSLTVADAASSNYALKVMTVAALILAPLILLYQGWTYHVFRGRLGGDRVEPAAGPPDAPQAPGAPELMPDPPHV